MSSYVDRYVRGFGGEEKAEYGWIIDVDHLGDGEEDTLGPAGIDKAMTDRLFAGEGTKFRLYDDDEILYYTGRIIGDVTSEEVAFAPLLDFGTPNAGCTIIKYRSQREDGTWTWEII